ncbi:lysylphosphatidylglycerol synthase transmembrane domain-containing protein [Crocosphaera watsonii]|uniref:Uncharacterized protein n=1 Tax=Crocosphaera watsonii WH 8502 TaxID=423474 RepID=T2IB10_CROWT|nr:lysylphosphatidylglycerol synthase transmembrane domain-containing protein [Crocosphaera watsonii]CCQ50019.1 Conserved hypothetical protein 374 [Crocosphaera watsonii WH 8502]
MDYFLETTATNPCCILFILFSSCFFSIVLYTLRWQLILISMEIKAPFFLLLRQYLIAAFFNNFLPTGIGGDWARIYYLGQNKGYVQVAASVFIDRFLGFFSLTIIGTLICWCFNFSSVVFLVTRNLLTVCLVLFFGVFLLAKFSRAENLVLNFGPNEGRWGSLKENFAQFIGKVRVVCQKPELILGVIVIGIVYLSITATIYQGFFTNLSDIEVNFWLIVGALASIYILTNIPITVNGIGLREQLHYLLFAVIGIPKELSVSVSLLIFSNILVISLAGYCSWLQLKLSSSKP